MCVCVIFFIFFVVKRDMFCLFLRVFRQRFLLVTRTDAFGGLSCAGMCENVCVFVCVYFIGPVFACLFDCAALSHIFVLLLSMCPFHMFV